MKGIFVERHTAKAGVEPYAAAQLQAQMAAAAPQHLAGHRLRKIGLYLDLIAGPVYGNAQHAAAGQRLVLAAGDPQLLK